MKNRFVVLSAVFAVIVGVSSTKLLASNSVIVGSVRVQMLSSSLVRLELKGSGGYEDRNTFHVADRNWPGTSYSSNVVSGEIVLTTANYVVHVPQAATSLGTTYVASPSGQLLYQFNGFGQRQWRRQWHQTIRLR